MRFSREFLQKQLDAFEGACRKAGLRVTHQRFEIYRELLMATDHPTAEALHRRLRTRLSTISLDTVYRNLSTLAAHGLINKVETAESLSRFEVTVIRHHHLICRKCSEIRDFMWPMMDDVALPEEIRGWGRIDQRNVVVYGICRACQDSEIT